MRLTHKKMINVALIISILYIGSCKKFIEVDAPVTSTNSENVYSNDATAIAVLTGVYTNMSNLNFDLRLGSITSMSLFPALSADELTLYNVDDAGLYPYYVNDLTSLMSSGTFWNSVYPIIYTCNSAIEGLSASTRLTIMVKQQLLGEAKFMRAFSYFYLVNLYGDLPVALGTNYKENALLPRSKKEDVMRQIIDDLVDATALLNDNYVSSDAISITDERVRPNKWAARALLARAYLYVNDFANAEKEATEVINNSLLFSLVDLDNSFLRNSMEAIWQLQPVRYGTQANTGEGALFVLPAEGPNSSDYPVYLSKELVDSFEIEDKRRVNWIDSVAIGNDIFYYPHKYKIGRVDMPTTEYIMILRLAEQYLIRAEARAQQGNFSGATSDLNTIRNRAALPNTTANNKASLLAAVMHERQLELFTEWGHRWFDLKRTGKINEVMSLAAKYKGAIWSPFKALYPIPQDELNRDPNLTQNEGY